MGWNGDESIWDWKAPRLLQNAALPPCKCCSSHTRPSGQPAPSSSPLHPPSPGRFARDCCPAYLTPSGFRALKEGGALEALNIENGFFLPTLNARQYTKVGRAGRAGERPQGCVLVDCASMVQAAAAVCCLLAAAASARGTQQTQVPLTSLSLYTACLSFHHSNR